MPRPRKPPLATKQPVHCKRNNHCAVDLSTSNPSLILTAALYIILVCTAGSPNRALRNRSPRDLVMALGSSAPVSSQWRDDNIAQSQLYDPQAHPISLEREVARNTCQSMIPKETHLILPHHLGTRPGHKRGFSSISHADEEDSNRQPKPQ
ncbi:hypothetical protein F5B18DRAFT_610427 [Nemania serpens]|nr:hypothetical protein F5B18DRAFT_610427 [Nemania serpens]